METVNVFVYGSLKRGYPNYPLFKDCILNTQKGTVIGTLYDIKLGFPAASLSGNYTIHGQVITIPKQIIQYMDQFEGVPYLYQRQQTDVDVENKKIRAYIYTMKALPFGASIIGSGQW